MGLRDVRRKQADAIRAASRPDPEFQRQMDIVFLVVFALPAFVIAIWGFASLPEMLDWAKTHSQEFNARVAVAMPFAAIFVGWLMYQLREHKRTLYAFIELGAAAGTAYSAWNNASTANSFSTALALSGALYISVRGFDNLYKARAEQKRNV
jgi:hypothetical protein